MKRKRHGGDLPGGDGKPGPGAQKETPTSMEEMVSHGWMRPDEDFGVCDM